MNLIKILLTTSSIYINVNYLVVTVSDSGGIIKSCFISFSPVGWLLTGGDLALTMAQEPGGINCRSGTPQTMHSTYRACALPIIRPHPLIYIFLLNFTKKDPPDPRNR